VADRPAVSYIVIEVRERDPVRSPGDAGFLRHLIHGLVRQYGLDTADILVRHDREESYVGTPEPWELIRAAFWSCMPRRKRASRG
jgi:hypothetical protein